MQPIVPIHGDGGHDAHSPTPAVAGRKILPLHDRILVKRHPEEQVTRGGLIIPGNAQEKPFFGEVLAVGPGRTLDDGSVRAICVKPGDIVMWSKYAGSTIAARGAVIDDEQLVMREEDLLAVIEDADTLGGMVS